MGRAFEVRKNAKAKTAAAKTKVYSKFGREIYVTAKNGTPDPDANLELKRVIEKAKKEQIPNDIIQRAIDKAKGNSDESYSEVRYEGFGPGESILIINTLTDNVNRTIANVRTAFNKCHAKLGVSGSGIHQFQHVSVFVINELTEDEVLEALVLNDLDIKSMENENGLITIYGEVNDYNNIKQALISVKEDLNFEVDEISWEPIMYIDLKEEEKETFERLVELLEDDDDVQNVYHNVGNI